jgi:hypothetical protein
VNNSGAGRWLALASASKTVCCNPVCLGWWYCYLDGGDLIGSRPGPTRWCAKVKIYTARVRYSMSCRCPCYNVLHLSRPLLLALLHHTGQATCSFWWWACWLLEWTRMIWPCVSSRSDAKARRNAANLLYAHISIRRSSLDRKADRHIELDITYFCVPSNHEEERSKLSFSSCGTATRFCSVRFNSTRSWKLGRFIHVNFWLIIRYIGNSVTCVTWFGCRMFCRMKWTRQA